MRKIWVAFGILPVGIVLLISGGLGVLFDMFTILCMMMAVISIFVTAIRAMAMSSMVMRKYGHEADEEWVKCPYCTGGAVLLGRKIPRHLWMDGGRDTWGPFWRPRQANVHACRYCQGRGWLIGTPSVKEETTPS